MRRLLVIVAVLLGLLAAGVAAVLMTVPAVAAPAPPARPSSQVVDGLYKSLVVVTPDGVTLICILTRLPQSFPHFTIPPEYTCVR